MTALTSLTLNLAPAFFFFLQLSGTNIIASRPSFSLAHLSETTEVLGAGKLGIPAIHAAGS